MNFELKEYYKIEEDITNHQLISEHLNRNLEAIRWINSNIDELSKEENIFPDYDWEFSKTIQALTIGSCILIYKFNKNPMFLIESENFINKKSLITFDVFVFVLQMFLNKIEMLKAYDLSEIRKEIINYKVNEHKEYKLNLSALYRINYDTELFLTTLDDKIIKYKF